MENLWSLNTPQQFWQCQPDPPEQIWREAANIAIPLLKFPIMPNEDKNITSLILGEEQFGTDHWQLGATRRIYYEIKPFLPRPFIILLKKGNFLNQQHFQLSWPVEDRYVRFLWEVIRQVLILTSKPQVSFRPFWPENRDYALVLTHDIETGEGQNFVREIADFEESLGLRSSFNFVPEGYSMDMSLVGDLRGRGFEIGVHGLKHDGKLFQSRSSFMKQAEKINQYLKDFGAVGFRSPLTHRNPEWMQVLDIEYDLSFFDTDPFEPMPGGSMCIWPYFIGHFVELPYTLVQDSTLILILDDITQHIWQQKLNFIREYHGMALLNTHPEYLIKPNIWKVYEEFLRSVKGEDGYWNEIPAKVAEWWRVRAAGRSSKDIEHFHQGTIHLFKDQIVLD